MSQSALERIREQYNGRNYLTPPVEDSVKDQRTYSEKLKDPRWQKKRLEVMSRDEFKCRLCWDDKTTLHVHHTKYNGEPWEADSDCLVTLCEHCHFIIELYDLEIKDVIVCEKNDFGNDIWFVMIYDKDGERMFKVAKVVNGELSAALGIPKDVFKKLNDKMCS